MPDKYIFKAGIPVLNPEYQAGTASTSTTSAAGTTSTQTANKTELTIVSTIADQQNMTALTNLNVPLQFQTTMTTMKSPAYIKQFNSDEVDGDALIEGLTNVFGQYEIPIGLMSKLTPYQGVKLHFKIDDSGSMVEPSNLLPRDLSSYMQQFNSPNKRVVSRWEEAQDRMHILIDLLAYVPTGQIKLSRFDHPGQPHGKHIVLHRTGKTPEEFKADAHQEIANLFSIPPGGGTPILANMQKMLTDANKLREKTDVRTMHYLISDGEPNGREEEIRQIKNLLISPERHPEINPFTFLGCSNRRADYAWMHEMEEVSKFVAVLPDFVDEKAEVMRDQGRAFPYTRGFWVLCNLAAATNPDDLDALDQHAPFTKRTLENLMGRGMTVEEFSQYFNHHPNARRIFGPDYQLFLTAEFAHEIPSVRLFKETLAKLINRDMDRDNDDNEDADVRLAEQAVLKSRKSANAAQYQSSMYYDNPNTRRKKSSDPANTKSKSCNLL